MNIDIIRMRKIGPDDARTIKVDVKIDGKWFNALDCMPNVIQATLELNFAAAQMFLLPIGDNLEPLKSEHLASSE